MLKCRAESTAHLTDGAESEARMFLGLDEEEEE